MTDNAHVLLSALQKERGEARRQSLNIVHEAYWKAFPHWRERADARDRLRILLQELDSAGELRLPKGAKGWDPFPSPSLPKWVEWPPKDPVQDGPRVNINTFPWVEELRFVASLRTLRDPTEAVRIHEFLKNGASTRPMVPIKERSWELFGDEKRLDGLKGGQLFGPGRLNLEVLRCYEVPSTLSCRPGPAGASGPFLILENEASFDSFARWNKEVAAHKGVILGNGNAVWRATRFLADLLEGGTAEYFGDLDEAGCEIPYELNRRFAESGTIRVQPAVAYYEWLLQACGVDTVPETIDSPKPWLAWFPKSLRPRVLAATKRLKPPPQEAVGWEWLVRHKQRISPFGVRDGGVPRNERNRAVDP